MTLPYPLVEAPDIQANLEKLDQRVTSAAGGAPPTGAAGGDLTGTYPNPTVKASVGLTGVPTAPSAAVDTNTTQLASTAFVLAQAGSSAPIVDGTGTVGTSTRFSRQDHIHPTDTSRLSATASAGGDLTGSYPNPTVKASVGLTGTPTAPTAAVDTNTTQLASTAFVLAQAGSATPLIDGTGAVGTSTRFARQDHIHPTDTSRLSATASAGGDLTGSYPNPTIKSDVGLGGNPTTTTQAVDDNTTRIATTAYVVGQGYAKLASPTFTGDPKAPTAAADDNDTSIATTAYVIGQKGTTTPIIDGTGAAGTSNKWTPIDHVHPTDTNLLALAPATAARNTVQPSADVQPFTLKGKASQTANLQEWQNSSATLLAQVASAGNATFGMDSSARGMSVGDAGTGSGYFGIAQSGNMTSTRVALRQGPNGDTYVNAASGQSLKLQINSTTVLTISAASTSVVPSGGTLSFFNVTPAARQTVTGSRGGNAALASLLTALANYGLVTDSSTA